MYGKGKCGNRKKIKPALYPKRGDRLLETETRGLMRRGLHTANKKMYLRIVTYNRIFY